MSITGGTVVSCGVTYNARNSEYRARISVQVFSGTSTRYERHKATFSSWAQVAAWFATWP